MKTRNIPVCMSYDEAENLSNASKEFGISRSQLIRQSIRLGLPVVQERMRKAMLPLTNEEGGTDAKPETS